jgi:hypothetical protein
MRPAAEGARRRADLTARDKVTLQVLAIVERTTLAEQRRRAMAGARPRQPRAVARGHLILIQPAPVTSKAAREREAIAEYARWARRDPVVARITTLVLARRRQCTGYEMPLAMVRR